MPGDAKLPMFLAGFLQDATNKEELFNLLTEDVVKHDYTPSKHMYITNGSYVKSNRADISMSANYHEEANGRMCLLVDDELNKGATTVLVRTTDTDVVAFWLEAFIILPSTIQECSYWSVMAQESISATTTSTQSAKNLGRKKLPFHSFSGSDATSQSAIKAKSQQGKHGKHIQEPLLDSPARLRMDLFLWN